MKKYFLVLFLTTLLVPQVVFAAWWNPFSWRVFHKEENKTQVLENRIKELEKKIDSQASTTKKVIEKVEKKSSSIEKKQEEKVQEKVVTPTKTAPKTFTTPNGAVIDEAGNVISVPTVKEPVQVPTNVVAGGRVLTGEEIYSLVSPAVAFISWSDSSYQYAGSGFVIKDGKYTLTNAHVLKSKDGSYASSVDIKLQNGVTFRGTVLGKNKDADVALIYNGSQRPPSVTFGSSGGLLKIGSDVYALGFPESFKGLLAVTFTKGTLSARQNPEWYSLGTLLQMDAAINHGNSGGPLVNNKGEVIGVNTFGLNETQGIYFAIPIQTVIDLIPSLSNYGQSRIELYPIGSGISIKSSMALRIDSNEELSCGSLDFKNDDLTLCDLYKNYKKDYSWTIIRDF